MKKKRYFPFGYRMTNGVMGIVPEESVLIQKLFNDYLTGISLKKLAEMAQQTGVKFRDNTERWNKNMIARMLDDGRYWNDDEFPPIVSKEIGSAIATMRNRRTTSRCSIQFINKKLICGNCGGSLHRNSKNSPRIRWDCSKCDQRYGPMLDSKLLYEITKKLQIIYQDLQVIEPEQSVKNSLSIQAARLTNEINQALNQREVNPNEVLSLILECAAEKYKVCGIKESDHLTIKIKALFQEHKNDEHLDQEVFKQTVKQVILRPDGTIQLRLLNEKIV